MGYRILFGGMVSSGKSTLICSLYQLLETWGEDVSLHEIDVWSDTHACILGEKSWEQRHNTRDNSPEIHTRFQRNVELFAADPAEIVLGDLPGREANDSFPLLKPGFADAGVLVTRGPREKDKDPFLRSTAAGWRKLMVNLWQIPLIAEVYSLRNGDQPAQHQFAIGDSDRGLIPHHPEVERLAEHLLAHVETHRLTTV